MKLYTLIEDARHITHQGELIVRDIFKNKDNAVIAATNYFDTFEESICSNDRKDYEFRAYFKYTNFDGRTSWKWEIEYKGELVYTLIITEFQGE